MSIDINPKLVIMKEFGDSRNFMTPNIIRYGMKGNIAYEFSWGEGITGGKIWGVSVASYDPDTDKTTREYDLSQCFHSRSAAEEHIERLGWK